MSALPPKAETCGATKGCPLRAKFDHLIVLLRPIGFIDAVKRVFVDPVSIDLQVPNILRLKFSIGPSVAHCLPLPRV
jgi:hypothetical protein